MTAQPLFSDLIATGGARLIDVRHLGDDLRLISSHAARYELDQILAQTLGQILAPADLDPAIPDIIFFGSGDYHHVTATLLARYEEPLTVIHFGLPSKPPAV